MNKGIKFVIAAALAFAATLSTQAAPVTVGAGAQSFTYLALENGTYVPTADNATLQIGTFAATPTDGSFSLAGFTAFVITNGVIDAGAFSVSATADEAGFAGGQIYLVVDDGSQRGIFYIAFANATTWKFPAGTDIPPSTAIGVEDLLNGEGTAGHALKTGAHIVFGSLAFDGTYSQLRLQTIPEPSSIALVGFGLLGLVGLARRRRS